MGYGRAFEQPDHWGPTGGSEYQDVLAGARWLQAQAGVDLDNEAVNLVRFQQAFQANGRVMQVASDIFDTLLAIK